MSSDAGARTAFAERLALLYKEAGNPPLKKVAEAVVRLQRVDERGRPVRVSVQRISDWRRAKNVPAQFAALAAVLHILIPQARRQRPTPVSAGLYDAAEWQRLWERAVGGRAAAAEEEEGRPAAESPAVPGVCPYRGWLRTVSRTPGGSSAGSGARMPSSPSSAQRRRRVAWSCSWAPRGPENPPC